MRVVKHKAVVGYCLLAIGTGWAIAGVEQAQKDSRSRGAVVRGIICKNITTQDEASLRALKTKADKELIKSLHLTPAEVKLLIEAQLRTSAKERKELQPSNPKSACSAKLTTLKVGA